MSELRLQDTDQPSSQPEMEASHQEADDDNNDIEFISGPVSGLSESISSESPVMISGYKNGSEEDQEVSDIMAESFVKPEVSETVSQTVAESFVKPEDSVTASQSMAESFVKPEESVTASQSMAESLDKPENLENQNEAIVNEALDLKEPLQPVSEPEPAIFKETSAPVAAEVPKENVEIIVPKPQPKTEEIEIIHRPDDVPESGMAGAGSSQVARREEEEWVDDAEESDDDEDFEETLLERLIGLTEMFPSSLRRGLSKTASGSVTTVKGAYHLTRNLSWIFFSSAVILFAPLLFESERAQMEQMQKQQERQILLGPGAAMSGAPPGGMGMMAPPPPR